MGRIVDFQCTYEHASGFGMWASEEFGIVFPKAYQEREEIASLAKAVKQHNGTKFCLLPFCHTLEIEALGGNIRLGGCEAGPRAGNYICRNVEDVHNLPALDVESDAAIRLRETLAACRILKEAGETVVFQVSGPLTILNGLVDSETLFRALLKRMEVVQRALEKLERDILTMMKVAEEAGADMLSYADPSGGVSLVGPKVAGCVAKEFTARLLKHADEVLNDKTPVFLCPKTALSLIGTEVADWKEHELPEAMDYMEAVLYMKKQIRYVGQSCVNQMGNRLEDRILKELVLR